MSLTIRQYRSTDQEAVVKLHVDGLSQFQASIGNPMLDQDIHHIEAAYMYNDGEFLVGVLDSRVVGMGGYRRHDNETAEIKRVRIDLAYQRRGIGQTILTTLEDSARAKGFKKLILDTTSKQLPAQNMFLRNGYRETIRKRFQDMEIIFYMKEMVLKQEADGEPL